MKVSMKVKHAVGSKFIATVILTAAVTLAITGLFMASNADAISGNL